MTQENPIVVDIIEDAISNMKVSGIHSINYEPGRSSQILEALTMNDYSNSFADKKYPLIALLMPVDIVWGEQYGNVRIERIVIATLTQSTDPVLKRYKEGGTFKSILYPCFNEFTRCLANSKYVQLNDPDALKFTQRDNPGVEPLSKAVARDYIDSIEILNLQFPVTKFKTC